MSLTAAGGPSEGLRKKWLETLATQLHMRLCPRNWRSQDITSIEHSKYMILCR